MATNFPTSQDNFTNPTSSDTLDSPDHAAQHTNVNDAVEAIELALLDGAPMYIDDTNERVGIGTNSPNYLLHVNGGDAFVSGDLTVDQGSPTNATLHVDSTNNRVGIGTTSPSVPLHVSSTSGEGLRIQKSNNDQQGSYIGFYDDDARLGYVGYAGNDDLYLENEATNGKTFLSCGGSIRLTIDNNTRGGVAYTPSTSYVSGGTWDFEYTLIDKSLTVNGEWTFTSGASVSSFWRIGLPSGLTWETDTVGTLIMTDFMYGGDHIGFSAGFAGGSDIFAYRMVQSGSTLVKGSSVTSTGPFTWGTSDSFKISISGTVA